MHTDRRRLVTGALALGAAWAAPARAQNASPARPQDAQVSLPAPDAYPNRPVRLVVPYPEEGATGVFSRLMGNIMAKILRQPFIEEYRPGNAAAIGAAETVAHSAPDGYTLLLGDISTYVLNRSLYRDLPYDPQKDFAPVTLTGRIALILLVNTKKISVKTLPELIEAARRAPGTIEYATPGAGTPSHLATELLADAAGIKLKHVPYQGAAPALQDLASGKVGVMFVDFVSARAHRATPGIGALAIASPEEYPAAPGVPTVAASGFPGFEAWVWQGLTVPAGTDADIIDKLRKGYVEMIKGPQIINRVAGAGFDILQSTPEEFGDYMRSETAKWEKVIRTANIIALDRIPPG
jgi:tripartite-type tricarboxylate transporter receptor subunit TctC